MSLNTPNFKNGTIRPRLPKGRYFDPIAETCPYCNGPGRKKVYKNTWCLLMHFAIHHKLEDYQKIIDRILYAPGGGHSDRASTHTIQNTEIVKH